MFLFFFFLVSNQQLFFSFKRVFSCELTSHSTFNDDVLQLLQQELEFLFKLKIFQILNFEPSRWFGFFVYRVFSFHAHTMQPAFAESMLCYIVILPLHTHSISFHYIPYHMYTQFKMLWHHCAHGIKSLEYHIIWVPDWYVGLHDPASTYK